MIEVIKRQISIDGTEKFLFKLKDGSLIESVLMKHDYGASACISTQVGCNMGCVFCASGELKKMRDLSAEEMYAQVEALEHFATGTQDQNDSVTNAVSSNDDKPSLVISRIVIMGTGEPFDNFKEVIDLCDTVSRGKEEITIVPRHITVSTCGLVPYIYEFSKTKNRYNLAISLHASNNEIRNRLMPINKKYPIEEVLQAACEYTKATSRRVAFEYLLIDGINDKDEYACELAERLNEVSASASLSDIFYVNIIPLNQTSASEYNGVNKEKALKFYDILMKNGIKATLRKERGTDISAACGQLRAESSLQTPNPVDSGYEP